MFVPPGLSSPFGAGVAELAEFVGGSSICWLFDIGVHQWTVKGLQMNQTPVSTASCKECQKYLLVSQDGRRLAPAFSCVREKK